MKARGTQELASCARANEILRKASAYFAMAELDRAGAISDWLDRAAADRRTRAVVGRRVWATSETFLDRRGRPGMGAPEDAKAPSRVVEMAELRAFETGPA